MPAPARVALSEERIPTVSMSSGPCSERQRHCEATLAPGGVSSAGQTTDISSAVQVIEKSRSPPGGRGGGAALAGRRQTAYWSGRRLILISPRVANDDMSVGARRPELPGGRLARAPGPWAE